jgi:hypothetical protein
VFRQFTLEKPTAKRQSPVDRKPSDDIPKKSMNVLFLGASLSTNNMGLGALTSGTVTSVLHAVPGSQMYLLDYGKEPQVYHVLHKEQMVSVPLVNIRFSKKFYLKNNIARLLGTVLVIKCLPSARFRRKLLLQNVYLKTLSHADVIASIAGGDSFSDIYGLPRLLYVTLPQIRALLVGKPLVLLPQTYGPFRSRTSRWIARFIVKRASLIYSRDQEGLKVVADLLGKRDTRVRFSFDMGFALEPLPPTMEIQTRLQKVRSSGKLVGFNVSGLLFMGRLPIAVLRLCGKSGVGGA